MVAPSRIQASPKALPATFRCTSVFGVVDVSLHGQVLGANRAFQDFLGYASLDEIRGKSLPQTLLAEPSDWAQWQQAASAPESRDIEMSFNAVRGTLVLRGCVERVASANGANAYLRGILVDGTSTSQLNELSVKTARMEALFSLYAGVSHDFNNLLTVLVGNLYLVSELVRGHSNVYEKVKRARDTAKRGADVLRQLLDLTRGADSDSAPESIAPQKVVATLAPLLSAALGSRIKLETRIGENVPAIRVNRAQLESVITNLVMNARDALASTSAPTGAVTVSVAGKEIAAAAATVAGVAPGPYVELAVRDNGCGVPDRIASKVFEPFFTTKPKGKGSGLGLPMVRWFAEKAGGCATLRSKPEQGTAVTLLLPAHQAEAVDTTILTVPLSALPGGTEPVVILSEDPDFRATVQQILSTLGYDAQTASSTAPAFSAPKPPSAVVLDSHALTEHAANRIDAVLGRQQCTVGIVIVGECRFSWSRPPVLVPKPFDLLELTRAVREAVRGD